VGELTTFVGKNRYNHKKVGSLSVRIWDIGKRMILMISDFDEIFRVYAFWCPENESVVHFLIKNRSSP
jgi:hypothetical protein